MRNIFMMGRLNVYLLTSLASCTTVAHQTIETVSVEGRHINLLGEAVSASQGVVGQKEIEIRPLLRTGEVLELIPGMVATQHSGTGKANQYFLRGFNLDHGTDFSTYIDGMPVNLRTHGHGQGYTDINFLIPEIISKLEYKKGAYYADVGDFSGAGNAEITTSNRVDRGLVSAQLGEDNFYRLLAIDSFDLAGGELLFAIEGNQYDGPWTDIEEDLEKLNLFAKHTKALKDGYFSLSLMAYDATWNSADQIPLRAVEQGIIDELGSIDDTVGGDTSRYSINAQWQKGAWDGSAYIIDYSFNLWSNFTYFLDDPINGDQFEQVDDRIIYGGQVNYQRTNNLFDGKKTTNRFGVELRVDDIDEVGLYRTQARNRLGVTRSDQVEETSIGLFWENRTAWSDHLRSVFGVRYDYFDFSVEDQTGTNFNGVDLSVNSGSTSDDLVSLKGSLIYVFDNEWEGYVSAGQGFHSNDARGTTIEVDPIDGGAVDSVDPLVKSFGYEAGLRGFIANRLNASVALWALELDSELLFVGDAGNTEASGASERSGLELTAYYQLAENWDLDFEYAYTDSKFSDAGPEGDEIPGSIETVFQAGVSVNFTQGWFGSLRVRHFGERPLIEDGSVKSDPTTIFNMRAGYSKDNWSLKADILNLSDSDDHDIDYFYASRLSTEAPGTETEDIHFHVIEPRTVRVSASYKF